MSVVDSLPAFGAWGVATTAREPLPARLEGVRLSARDGARLLDDLTLTIEAGGVVALMGANGAGKSLTLKLIQGLIAPDAGRVTLGGRPIDAAARASVGFVLQRPVLLRRRVGAVIEHALRARGVARLERPAEAAALLALCGVSALAERPARALSGGEQGRVAIARALAGRPRLLLLDEPTASLDPTATAAIESLIGRIAAAGATVVLVTHDIGQARRLADRVVFLHRGRAVEAAAAAAFFRAPRTREAAAYLAGRLEITPETHGDEP